MSASEWLASARIATEPLIRPPTSLAMAMPRLAPNATATVVRVARPPSVSISRPGRLLERRHPVYARVVGRAESAVTVRSAGRETVGVRDRRRSRPRPSSPSGPLDEGPRSDGSRPPRTAPVVVRHDERRGCQPSCMLSTMPSTRSRSSRSRRPSAGWSTGPARRCNSSNGKLDGAVPRRLLAA